jgi:uncharacterized membrane protein YfcA
MLALPVWLWVVTLASGLIASTVTTVTGIGAGLIIYGILGFFFDLKVLIVTVAPAQLLAGSLRFWLFRHHVHWRLALVFFLGVTPGIVGGSLLFHVLSEAVLRRTLGMLLLGFAAYEGLQSQPLGAVPHRGWLPLAGFCAGLLLGSMGVPGPFLAVVFLRYGLVKEELVAMIALFFLLGNAQRTLLYWSQGRLTDESLGLVITLGAAMLVGVYLGRFILPRLSRDLFVRLVLIMLLLFGVKFLLW